MNLVESCKIKEYIRIQNIRNTHTQNQIHFKINFSLRSYSMLLSIVIVIAVFAMIQ